jgi:hypothetical protein
MSDPVEFDLHGLAGVRLLDATERDAAVVARQLGPIQAPLRREPDITIRFVDRLPLDQPLRYLGLDDVAFTDDAFILLRSQQKSPARVQIPFDQIGRGLEITCERGLPAVPLLISILNLTVLANGALPLHASAFVYQGKGVLVTGWAKGGKTETLLAFMEQGATYVGDEWVYLSCDGRHMWGIPEPMRLWQWHLDELPRYAGLVSRSDRLRLRGLRLMLRPLEQVSGGASHRQTQPVRLLRRLVPLLKRQQNVQLAPQKLFGAERCISQAEPALVFFVGSQEAASNVVQPVEPSWMAQRMRFSLEEERMNFLSYYLKFRFAFPGAANDLIERRQELEQSLLQQALSGKEAYAVYHPYPVSIPSLFDALRPYVEGVPHGRGVHDRE